MDELLPGVDQRFCVRHLYNNFRKKYPGKKLKELMWKAAKASYVNAFNDALAEIKQISEGAYEYLMKIPARHWSKSKFTSGPLCDTLVNNMSEAFNSTIVIARGKPVVTMFEEIRVYLMERWETNRQNIARYEGVVLPNIKKRIEKESAYTNNWLVRYVIILQIFILFSHYAEIMESDMIFCAALSRRSTEHDYEVRHIACQTNEKYHVNLLRRECDCRRWLLTGLPCCHAISCMKSQNMNIYEYVPDCYKKERYADCYSSVIYPANGQCLWERIEYADLQPPPIRRQPGRPKKKRTRDPNELLDHTQLKRARWGMKCSRCKQSGHNKSTCKLPPPPVSSAPATSSVQPPQPPPAYDGSSNPTAPAPASVQPPPPPPASVPARTSRGSGSTNQAKARRRKGKEPVSSTQPMQVSKRRKSQLEQRVLLQARNSLFYGCYAIM